MGDRHSRADTEADKKNGRSNGRVRPTNNGQVDPLLEEKRQRQERLQHKKRERSRDELDLEAFEEIDPEELPEQRASNGKKKKKRDVHPMFIIEEDSEIPPPHRRRKGRRAQLDWDLDWDE